MTDNEITNRKGSSRTALTTQSLILLPLIGALVAYYLPWLSNRAAALSANAYDLAEWVSIYPPVRGGDGTLPPLFAPFLLRAVLGGLGLLFGWNALRSQAARPLRIFSGALGLCLAITLLPPPDFFRGGWDDSNYRQQFFLAIGTLILLGLGLFLRQRDSWLRLGQLIIAVLCTLMAVVGEILALNVVRALGVSAPVGIGVILMVGCLVLTGVLVWRKPGLE